MSDFAVTVERITIEPHPNADAIELARIGDFRSIVRKGEFQTGDLGVYIPEQAIVPDWMLEKMGLTGKLSGSAKNRVKAIKLRGIVSQGLVYPGNCGDEPNPSTIMVETLSTESPMVCGSQAFKEGDNVAEWLGIVKHEPKLPQQMMGRVAGVDLAATTKYDFDNLKRIPNLFDEGEEVVITEKIHGTLLMIGVMPKRLMNEKYYKDRVIVSSKGMGQKGWILDTTAGEGAGVHVQAALKHGLLDKWLKFADLADRNDQPMFLFGEVYGGGIQDLNYGAVEHEFRAFDACIGAREQAEYVFHRGFQVTMYCNDIATVPVLYEGPFKMDIVRGLTDGLETVSGKCLHIREGIVIKAAFENPHPKYGRKIAKSVSDAYLLRKNGTEFN